MEGSKFFSLMVVGNNPDEMVKKYDSTVEVEPYVKYRYKDAGKLRERAIRMFEEALTPENRGRLNDFSLSCIEDRVKALKGLSDFEYYTYLTDGLTYNEDGDAISTENPDGKYETCRIGRNLCIPLELKDGQQAFQAYVRDVDWGRMHMVGCDLYRVTWQLYHGELKPRNANEEQIYNNVRHQRRYFDGFKSMDEYVSYNCSYWNYAYLDKDGWKDASDYKNYDWIVSFYDRFVKSLDGNDVVTIYECSKK